MPSLRLFRDKAPEEFRAVVATSISLAFAVILLPAIHVIMEGDRPGRRRGMLATTSLLTLCVLAAPFGRRIWGLDVVGEEPTGRCEQTHASGQHGESFEPEAERSSASGIGDGSIHHSLLLLVVLLEVIARENHSRCRGTGIS